MGFLSGFSKVGFIENYGLNEFFSLKINFLCKIITIHISNIFHSHSKWNFFSLRWDQKLLKPHLKKRIDEYRKRFYYIFAIFVRIFAKWVGFFYWASKNLPLLLPVCCHQHRSSHHANFSRQEEKLAKQEPKKVFTFVIPQKVRLQGDSTSV